MLISEMLTPMPLRKKKLMKKEKKEMKTKCGHGWWHQYNLPLSQLIS